MKISKDAKIRLQKVVDVAEVKKGENVLDLGCGEDEILRVFLPSDIKYTGVDMRGGSVQYNLERGLPKKLKQQRFDIIFMNEFIEHIENFKSILKECRDILTENGRIVISTPSNFRILYGDFFDGIGENPGHIHCFRKTNMRNLARICDLRITDIKGTYIRFPFLLPNWIVLPTNQTIYTETIVYRLERRK